jgi:hypothetical protein
VWYGYYHNERSGVVCGETGKVLPRIGVARSYDRGLTWEDLGPIIEAPPGTSACDNYYFHGGVGDVSVMLESRSPVPVSRLRAVLHRHRLTRRRRRPDEVGEPRRAAGTSRGVERRRLDSAGRDDLRHPAFSRRCARGTILKASWIYVSFNETLDPSTWSPPRQLTKGGRWYPQVMGLGEEGTDKVAGETARFFMSGHSDYLIEFMR